MIVSQHRANNEINNRKTVMGLYHARIVDGVTNEDKMQHSAVISPSSFIFRLRSEGAPLSLVTQHRGRKKMKTFAHDSLKKYTLIRSSVNFSPKGSIGKSHHWFKWWLGACLATNHCLNQWVNEDVTIPTSMVTRFTDVYLCYHQ